MGIKIQPLPKLEGANLIAQKVLGDRLQVAYKNFTKLVMTRFFSMIF